MSALYEITKQALFVIAAIGPTVVVIIADLLLYPFARYILPKLNYKQNVWTQFIVGFSLALFIFKKQIITPIIMALVTYFILDWNPFFTISVAFIFSSAVHIYCMVTITTGWQWMVNSITMIMFQKVWMTTVNIFYGRKIEKGEKVRPIFEKSALKEKPPLLEWMTYVFSPFGSTSGPNSCYKIQEFTFGVGERPRISDDSKSHKAARKRFYMTFFWLVVSFISIKYANIEFYKRPIYVNANYIGKLLLMMVCTLLHTVKYFSAWQSVEAGLYETGAGESGITEFDDISNLTIFDVLMSDSVGIWLQRWNHSAHIFWKNYLLYPLLDLGVKYSLANPLIFVFSALWHGFHPVYYMLLPEMLAATTADQLINGMFPNLIKNGNFVVVLIYRFWIWMSMLVTTSTWWYRSADAFFFVRKSQDYFGTILIFIVFAVVKVTSLFIKVKPRVRKPAVNDSKAEEIKKETTEKENSEEKTKTD
ncbi:MBOAT family protein [Tritrichomonas foetus]|uniref:MBOAT family protein n=1 Tax=Tritrichomonas foetus TaxID=1144522 RepID=A0A1J4KVY1_9EUKA|nr:MBOAT family protein [Tritrichomonas foetus]|eukprot:OHT13908.1 MBOAT family protein [Tritrichomonas foetus]